MMRLVFERDEALLVQVVDDRLYALAIGLRSPADAHLSNGDNPGVS